MVLFFSRLRCAHTLHVLRAEMHVDSVHTTDKNRKWSSSSAPAHPAKFQYDSNSCYVEHDSHCTRICQEEMVVSGKTIGVVYNEIIGVLVDRILQNEARYPLNNG